MSKLDRRITVVSARRAVRLAAGARPIFVGVSTPRLWMESLEQRRVLSAALATSFAMADPGTEWVCTLRPANIVQSSDGADDGSGSDDGSTDDGSTDVSSTDDGSTDDSSSDDGTSDEPDAPAVPTSNHYNDTTYVEMVDGDGNVVQSYKITDIDFEESGNVSGSSLGDGGSSPEYYQVSIDDLQYELPSALSVGESSTFKWDDETGMPTPVGAVPGTADSGSQYGVATRVASDDPTLVALRTVWNTPDDGTSIDETLVDDGSGSTDDGSIDPNDAINNGGPTNLTVKGTTQFDVVDADGNVVQSYRVENTTFGAGDIAPDGYYYQVSVDELAYELPKALAQGESVTFTWDDSGMPVIASIPTTADPYTTFSTATRIATDDPAIVQARTDYNTFPEPVDYWSTGAADDGGYVDYERGDGNIYYAMGGLGATPTSLPGDVASPTPTDVATPTATSNGSSAIPLGPLPTVEPRSTNDILTSHKDDDIMGTQSAELLSVIR